MKKYILTFVLLTLIVIAGNSQSLKKIAENKVSNTTTVITYQLVEGAPSNVQDSQTPSSISINQQKVIDYFLALEGVNDATFDKATQTYTVVTNNTAQLPKNLNLK